MGGFKGDKSSRGGSRRFVLFLMSLRILSVATNCAHDHEIVPGRPGQTTTTIMISTDCGGGCLTIFVLTNEVTL